MTAVRQRDAANGQPARHRSRDAGFSLVEILVALGVFAVLGVACATIASDSLGVAGDNQNGSGPPTSPPPRWNAPRRCSVPRPVAFRRPPWSGRRRSTATATVTRAATWVDAEGDAAQTFAELDA